MVDIEEQVMDLFTALVLDKVEKLREGESTTNNFEAVWEQDVTSSLALAYHAKSIAERMTNLRTRELDRVEVRLEEGNEGTTEVDVGSSRELVSLFGFSLSKSIRRGANTVDARELINQLNLRLGEQLTKEIIDECVTRSMKSSKPSVMRQVTFLSPTRRHAG